MLFIKQALVFTTLLCSALAAPHHHDDSIVDWERLNSILDSIDSEALHSVLHAFTPKFRDGVFSKDRAAIEHVHSENPILASKIVYIAKRQNNGTTTESRPSSTAGVRTTNNANSPSPTTVAAVAPAVSSAVSEQITQTSASPRPTTILIAPSASSGETPIATVSGAVVYSTQGGGVVTRTSSAVTVRFTQSTSTHLYYSTAPDGTVMTSTSLVVVNAPVTETAVPTGAAGAAATSAGLQNAADRSNHNNVFAGFVLGAAGLFLGL